MKRKSLDDELSGEEPSTASKRKRSETSLVPNPLQLTPQLAIPSSGLKRLTGKKSFDLASLAGGSQMKATPITGKSVLGTSNAAQRRRYSTDPLSPSEQFEASDEGEQSIQRQNSTTKGKAELDTRHTITPSERGQGNPRSSPTTSSHANVNASSLNTTFSAISPRGTSDVEDELALDAHDVTMAIKRGRGRLPKKSTTDNLKLAASANDVDDNAAMDPSLEQTVNQKDQGDTYLGDVVTPAKRGPGRPKGSTTRRSDNQKEARRSGRPKESFKQAIADVENKSGSVNVIENAPGNHELTQSVFDLDEDRDMISSPHIESRKRGRGRPKGSKTKSKIDEKEGPQDSVEAAYSTPKKKSQKVTGNGTPSISRNTNRSARKKSARALIERTINGDLSDQDEEDELVQQIYDDDGNETIDDLLDIRESVDGESATPTPSKRGRGRPKGSKNRRSPTPSLDLPPHELYFAQNKSANAKTSNNNLSSLKLLDHEEYFSIMNDHKDSHAEDMAFLQQLHSRSFNQWQFELNQDFNVCVYGWGSKRALLTKFAEYVHKSQQGEVNSNIIIINGYVHNLTVREVLNTIAFALAGPGQKLGSQPADMLESVLDLLEADTAQRLTLIIHSLDAPPLRRAPAQLLLSQLAAHPQVGLIASADHPQFPLLWDSSLRATYNFLFHDCTTFGPFSAAERDVVDEVNELLGRSGRGIGGRGGVGFVLRSLPENAKNLFRVLVAEQLALMEDGGAGGMHSLMNGGRGGYEDEDDDEDEGLGSFSRASGDVGVEYRYLYQKATEEFICGNEVAFRTLLKEFHDHQMIQSKKDIAGTEILSVPFRKEELETILEDLMA